MIEQIKKVLVDALNIDEETITPEANLKDDLGIDSLAAVELALSWRLEFDIRIEDDGAGEAGDGTGHHQHH